MQQGLSADVVVEARHGAAQLGQPQPQPHVGRFIAHEDRHAFSLAQAEAVPKRSRHLIAALVRLSVGVRLVAEKQERLVRRLARFLQKDPQDGVHRPPTLVAAQPPLQVCQLQEVAGVLEEVGAAEIRHKRQEQQPRQSRVDGEHDDSGAPRPREDGGRTAVVQRGGGTGC